ncbi:MAG: UDP-glucose 4-epimerase GalE, partial [Phycisphaerales bacterium]
AIRRAVPTAAANMVFWKGDIGDAEAVGKVLAAERCEAVMHFAAYAYVGESVHEPLMYYTNNVGQTLGLLRACDAAGVERFVFSSTNSTYGEPTPDKVPIGEDLEQRPINPYGASKFMVERILTDYAAARKLAGKPFGLAILRYFNVAGCDQGGVLGEHHDPETHLIPVVLQCLLGRRPQQDNTVTVFGTDYPTVDGTCIRDYIHVDDLVDAHTTVLAALRPGERRVYNLGIGKGSSVKEIIAAAEAVSGRKVKVAYGPRRAGDPAMLFANPSRIKSELAWQARVTDLRQTVKSAWNWFESHPQGYGAS